MKADLAIYINMLGVPGQYKSVALILGYKLDFSCCANRNSFRRDSHLYYFTGIHLTASVYRSTTVEPQLSQHLYANLYNILKVIKHTI